MLDGPSRMSALGHALNEVAENGTHGDMVTAAATLHDQFTRAEREAFLRVAIAAADGEDASRLADEFLIRRYAGAPSLWVANALQMAEQWCSEASLAERKRYLWAIWRSFDLDTRCAFFAAMYRNRVLPDGPSADVTTCRGTNGGGSGQTGDTVGGQHRRGSPKA